jgi:hypothetical protein
MLNITFGNVYTCGLVAFYPMDNIPVFGKLITTFPVRVLAEAGYRQSSMEGDDDKAVKNQKRNSSLNQ